LDGRPRIIDLDQDLDPHLEFDGDVEVDPVIDLGLGPRSGEHLDEDSVHTRVDVQGRG